MHSLSNRTLSERKNNPLYKQQTSGWVSLWVTYLNLCGPPLSRAQTLATRE